MRKQTKWAVVLGAAAVMTFGACMTSFAASGWVDEDGDWYWYDNNGDAVENEWKKASDGKWYYLGDDGAMVTDAMIDDEYYVNENGTRVVNEWRKLVSLSDDAEESWYYFSSTGKSYQDTTRTIGGKKYTFNADGEMEYGWVEIEDKYYYHGEEDDGARFTSKWAFVEDEDEDDEYWYYFPSSGARATNKRQKVNGKSYYFNTDGQMLTEWIIEEGKEFKEFEGTLTATNSDVVRYLGEENDGLARTSAWAYLTEPGNENSDEKWYYFDSNGAPYVGNGKAEDSIKKINSKYYGFDKNGKMITGGTGDDTALTFNGKPAFYYFGGSSDGAMKTGRNTVTDDYDDSYVGYFQSSGTIATGRGTGITEEKSSVLYLNGLRVEAPEDSKYAVLEADEAILKALNIATGSNVADNSGLLVISESGKVQRSKKNLKTGGEYYLTTDANGFLKEVSATSGGKNNDDLWSRVDDVEIDNPFTIKW